VNLPLILGLAVDQFKEKQVPGPNPEMAFAGISPGCQDRLDLQPLAVLGQRDRLFGIRKTGVAFDGFHFRAFL